jgi:hypothetical protein
MEFVWYNPDTEKYEKGSMLDYDRKLLNSENRDRFNLVFEFKDTKKNMAGKMVKALNLVRKLNPKQLFKSNQ